MPKFLEIRENFAKQAAIWEFSKKQFIPLNFWKKISNPYQNLGRLAFLLIRNLFAKSDMIVISDSAKKHTPY